MADYDLVIAGGRVIDPETNLDAVRNVGIKGEKIAAVTEKAIQGKETIDASGHVVCPASSTRITTTAPCPSGRSWRCGTGSPRRWSWKPGCGR